MHPCSRKRDCDSCSILIECIYNHFGNSWVVVVYSKRRMKTSEKAIKVSSRTRCGRDCDKWMPINKVRIMVDKDVCTRHW